MFQTLKPRNQVEGSGMGLAIVRKTIEHYGGRVDIECDPPTRGTAFVFTGLASVPDRCRCDLSR